MTLFFFSLQLSLINRKSWTGVHPTYGLRLLRKLQAQVGEFSYLSPPVLRVSLLVYVFSGGNPLPMEDLAFFLKLFVRAVENSLVMICKRYYMAMQSYEISLWVLRYFSTQEEKVCFSKQPCVVFNLLIINTNEIPIQWITMKGAIFICNYGNSDIFTCEDDMLSSSSVFARMLLCSGKCILFRYCHMADF